MTNYTNASPVFSDTMQILETTDTNHADNFNQAFEALMDNSLANRNDIEKNIKMNNRLYKGVDLAIKFASEIVPFSNIWTWIKNRINNHNFEGLRVGDYITWTLNGETIKSKIAGLNTYRRTTDNEVEWHIDFISEDCYSQTVQWNTTNNNNGNAQNSCPYMASNLKTFLESLEANLPTALKNVITNKRVLLETRYSSSGALTSSTGWGWQDMGKLWVPTEYEVFGSVCWGTPGWTAGQAVQYELFANSWEDRIKGAGNGGSRCNWWLACAIDGSSAFACIVSNNGDAGYYNASSAYRVPVCFRIAES